MSDKIPIPPNSSRAWSAYADTYRQQEVALLIQWVLAGYSGAVAGLPGSGKSNVLGFLSHRPDVVAQHVAATPAQILFLPVDLNILPDRSLATFYRVILRAFYERRHTFSATFQECVTAVYAENKTARDAFLPQSGLRELLIYLQAEQTKVVFVIDKFDDFCDEATPAMANTLRGLRDSFKDTLCYILGMRQDVVYLANPEALGELYEILDTHVCWVGAMAPADAHRLIAEETITAVHPPSKQEIEQLQTLTGRQPALMKAACHWWATQGRLTPQDQWPQQLFAAPSVQYRLQELWRALSQAEQSALVYLTMQSKRPAKPVLPPSELAAAKRRLMMKGIGISAAHDKLKVCPLLRIFITQAAPPSRGVIWLEAESGTLYQGEAQIEGLSPLSRDVLQFLLQNPRLRHTKTDIIVNAWPKDLRIKGVTDDSLYQVIAGLRKQIEPESTKPCYIVNWRGHPEGGYQFFPEGRPN